MSFGKMNTRIRIFRNDPTTDPEGFAVKDAEPLADVRAYKEDRHGTESWKNRAAFTTAMTLFRFRTIPRFHYTRGLFIVCEGERYDIFSAEDVKGRGMYTEVLAERTEPDG